MTATLDYRCERARSRSAEVVFSTLLLMTLIAVGTFSFVSMGADQDLSRRERRIQRRSPRPTLHSLAEFPADFRDWYGSNFAFRNQLVKTHALIWLRVFRLSPNDLILLGSDDWLFTTASRSLDSERGVIPFNDRELDDWRRTLEARRDWLASLGIDYAFVIVPDKPSIYPELLPNGYAQVAPSRVEQFVSHMHESTDLRVIDLRPDLLAAKQDDRADDHICYPLGTHWTDRGAYHGYRSIARELDRWFPAANIWSLDDFTRPIDPRPDDESASLFLENQLSQVERSLKAKRERSAMKVRHEVPSRADALGVWDQADSSLPRLHLIHDSSAIALTPFLSQHFARTTCDQSDSFAAWTILETKPDLVLQVYVARFAQRILPSVQTVFDDEELRERFDASKHVLLPARSNGRYPRIAGYRGTAVEGGGTRPPVIRLAALSDGCLIDEPAGVQADEMTVLRLEVECPADSVASVYYLEAEIQGFRHQRCVTVPVREGHNEVFFLLASPTMHGPLLLRPGYHFGNYTIHDVELRAVPR